MTHKVKFARSWAYALIAVACAAGSTHAGSTTVTVNATSGPWSQVLNPTFDYGSHDNLAPTIVSAVNGLNFTAGHTLTLTYLSGMTSSFAGVPPTVDANGYVDGVFKNDDPGSTGNGFPSKYMGPWPPKPNVWLNELVGTFTNAAGVIVGNPFPVGDGPTTLTIPTGATQLQLGVNDDVYTTGPIPAVSPNVVDNSGSLQIQVSDGAVPEPGTLSLFGIGIAGLAVRRWRLCRSAA